MGLTASAVREQRGKRSGTEARVHGFGELEAVLMQRIWDHGGTLTVRDLFEELREERNIAYTTVMSTMDNLHRKGWLARERDGKAYRYTAVASREEYSARLMREAMAEAGDTEAVLSHFVAQMDGSESAALRAVLDEARRRPAVITALALLGYAACAAWCVPALLAPLTRRGVSVRAGLAAWLTAMASVLASAAVAIRTSHSERSRLTGRSSPRLFAARWRARRAPPRSTAVPCTRPA